VEILSKPPERDPEDYQKLFDSRAEATFTRCTEGVAQERCCARWERAGLMQSDLFLEELMLD